MHNLIVGQTGSGKSLLSKSIAHRYLASKQKILVYNPTRSEGWPPKVWTSDADLFLEIAQKEKDLGLFIDDAGNMFGQQYSRRFEWLATIARNSGHVSHFICQRPKQVPPNVRDQCTICYAFRLSWDDAKELAVEFSSPLLLSCHRLPHLQLYRADRFRRPVKFSVPLPGASATNGKRGA